MSARERARAFRHRLHRLGRRRVSFTVHTIDGTSAGTPFTYT